jgi:hypothetical protein
LLRHVGTSKPAPTRLAEPCAFVKEEEPNASYLLGEGEGP